MSNQTDSLKHELCVHGRGDKGDKGEIDPWSTPQINLDNLVGRY